MAIILTDSKHYTDIADALRECGPVPGGIRPSEMAQRIKQACEYNETRLWNDYCHGNLENITIQDATLLRPYMFYGQQFLQTVICTGDQNITTRTGVFSHCVKLQCGEWYDRIVDALSDSLFYGCSSFVVNHVPSSCTTIHGQAFRECTSIKEFKIHSNVNNIKSKSFYGCTSLKAVTFEGTPSSMAVDTFEGCTNLYAINVPWAQGEVSGAPWGATSAAINYNYVQVDTGEPCLISLNLTGCRCTNYNSSRITAENGETINIVIEADAGTTINPASIYATYQPHGSTSTYPLHTAVHTLSSDRTQHSITLTADNSDYTIHIYAEGGGAGS